MYISRKSNHIQDDIKRNWSSWNFGQEGFEGTKDELDDYLAKSTDERPVWISGFDIYPSQINEFEFGELYPDYWVAIDNVNTKGGLSCIVLKADTIEEAILESEKVHHFGDGNSFDATNATLVYSFEDIHIFHILDC